MHIVTVCGGSVAIAVLCGKVKQSHNTCMEAI
jgi:hypothetical protein